METEKEVEKILQELGVKCDIRFICLSNNPNWGEDKLRPLYRITLTTKKGIYSYFYWGSIREGNLRQMSEEMYARKKYKCEYSDLSYEEKHTVKLEFTKELKNLVVTPYAVVADLQKYDIGTFEDFCLEFGYDVDSRRALQCYLDVQAQYSELCKIFSEDELERLREIN